jgi:peptidoglycan hydrolase-like protein with peptidoglycan-binding domain
VADKTPAEGGNATAESGAEADQSTSSTTFSYQGSIPPVAPIQDHRAKSASDLAFEADDDGPGGTRFHGDATLGAIESNGKTLKLGDTGQAVRKVQQALFDLEYRPIDVTGTYDQVTADQVQRYQIKEGVGAKDGTLDGATFRKIEKDTSDLSRYARAAEHAPPGVHATAKGTDAKDVPVLLDETHELDAGAAKEARSVITPGKADGEVGEFHQTIPAGMYGPRMEAMLLASIDDRYATAKDLEHHHEHGSKLSMGQLEGAGNAAKDQVDAVFGSWATGAKMKGGTNLVDRYEDDTAHQKAESADRRRKDARARARYITNTESQFHDLDREHSADRSRSDEHEILDKVLDRVTAVREKELLLITATWSASTDETGTIRIQRNSDGTDDGERALLWQKFGTLVHEYMHSLTHPTFRKFRNELVKTDPEGAHTLTEGVTELLARTVLSQVNVKDPKLRKQVLGRVPDDDEEPDLDRDGYEDAVSRAKALVGVVGINNLYAAYFLGETKLIGA